jgi:hypothetical protein
MGKLIFLFGFVALISISCLKAQENNEVPAHIKSSFEKKYPNVKNVKWNKGEEAYEAKFIENGIKIAIHMNKNGKEISKEYYVKVSDLPQRAQNYLRTKYSGTDFNEVSKVVNVEGETHYEAGTNGKEIFFDYGGNFVKIERYNSNG